MFHINQDYLQSVLQDFVSVGNVIERVNIILANKFGVGAIYMTLVNPFYADYVFIGSDGQHGNCVNANSVNFDHLMLLNLNDAVAYLENAKGK